MTMRSERFGRVLSTLFDELAEARTPDYLEAAIDAASSQRQRPAWTYPGRWLPVQITTQAIPAGRMPWRTLGILALVAILIAALAAAYVGSRLTIRPAPFFGPAANGSIVVERAGDIVRVDPATGEAVPLVTGPELDSAPAFSRDGRMLAFERRSSGASSRPVIMVAAADGTRLTQATAEPISSLEKWTLSPDGRSVAVTSRDSGRASIQIVRTDGSARPIPLAVQVPMDSGLIESARFRPPDGREILVVGQADGGLSTSTRGLYLFDSVSGALVRTIVEPADDHDVCGAWWSPDGGTIGYCRFPLAADGLSARMYTVSADGTGARPYDPTPGVAYDLMASDWSNDGSRFVLLTGNGTRETLSVASTAPGVARVPIACSPSGLGPDGCPDTWVWAPDDTVLLGVRTAPDGATSYVLVDPDTGTMTPRPWEGDGVPDWQRLER